MAGRTSEENKIEPKEHMLKEDERKKCQAEMRTLPKQMPQTRNTDEKIDREGLPTDWRVGLGILKRHFSLTDCCDEGSRRDLFAKQRSASSCSTFEVQMASRKVLHLWKARASSASSLGLHTINN
eukprot:gene15284-6495_t